MAVPDLCVVDTNVLCVANYATEAKDQHDISPECILASIEIIDEIETKKAIVVDEDDIIFTEYKNNLSLSGQPGHGDAFMKWLHDYRFQLPTRNRVKINEVSDSYNEFPEHEGLKEFDLSDRKFVAVSNAHTEKPPILQATDSKWWGWKEALRDVGVTVHFICTEYIEEKYKQKMGI